MSSFIIGGRLEGAEALSEAQCAHVARIVRANWPRHTRVALRGSKEFDALYTEFGCGVEERRYPMASYDVEQTQYSGTLGRAACEKIALSKGSDIYIAAFVQL